MAETGAENMKFFLSYLNQRKNSIIVFILFSAVFSVSFILYDIICTEKAATLDFSGVADIFVTN